MAEQKRRSRAGRLGLSILRVLGSTAVTVAKTIGAMGGSNAHIDSSQRVLYQESKRKDYRP